MGPLGQLEQATQAGLEQVEVGDAAQAHLEQVGMGDAAQAHLEGVGVGGAAQAHLEGVGVGGAAQAHLEQVRNGWLERAAQAGLERVGVGSFSLVSSQKRSPNTCRQVVLGITAIITLCSKYNKSYLYFIIATPQGALTPPNTQQNCYKNVSHHHRVHLETHLSRIGQ